jgi:hypothetical protein
LSSDQRRQRQRLFGNWTDGLRPIRPYWWQLDGSARLLEIPVTTMPLFRVPIHFSYLLYLRQFSRVMAWAYWQTAMTLCWATGVEPSLLLHPLDFLGGDEEPDLGFFPAMSMRGDEKRAFVGTLLADFARRFNVLPMGEHASIVSGRSGLRTRALPEVASPPTHVSQLPPRPEPAFTVEASRR